MNKFVLGIAMFIALTFVGKAADTAKLQVIHNASDPAAKTVDIYIGAMKALDDFAFRTASPFVDLPAGVPVVIGVAPGTSTSVSDVLATFTVTLEPNGTYLGIANGVLSAETFAANPDGTPIGFKIFAIDGARTQGSSSSSVDLKVFHGVTDVGAVDIYAGTDKLFSNVGYGGSTQYATVPPSTYTVGVAPTGGSAIATFSADLSKLGGAAVTVIASGFLDPSKNNDGEPFGLFAVTKDGGPFIPLPAVVEEPKAIVQIVHNSADPIADSVDIYVNGTLAIDNFAFRSATPPLDLEPNTAYNIGVAPKTSTTAADTLVNFNVTLPAGRYVVFANGLVQSGFAANPSGESTAFTIYPITNVRTAASTSSSLDFAVFHGASDAPAVDVRVSGTNLVAGLAYGKSSPYVSVPAQDYTVDVALAGGAVLASYRVPGVALTGKSAIVFASGFLDPATNKNGAGFGLFALVGSDVVRLQETTTSVRDVEELPEVSVAPNPTFGNLSARFFMPVDASVQIRIHDITGTLITEASLGQLSAGQHVVPFSMSTAASGSHIMTIDAGTYRSVLPFVFHR